MRWFWLVWFVCWWGMSTQAHAMHAVEGCWSGTLKSNRSNMEGKIELTFRQIGASLFGKGLHLGLRRLPTGGIGGRLSGRLLVFRVSQGFGTRVQYRGTLKGKNTIQGTWSAGRIGEYGTWKVKRGCQDMELPDHVGGEIIRKGLEGCWRGTWKSLKKRARGSLMLRLRLRGNRLRGMMAWRGSPILYGGPVLGLKMGDKIRLNNRSTAGWLVRYKATLQGGLKLSGSWVALRQGDQGTWEARKGCQKRRRKGQPGKAQKRRPRRGRAPRRGHDPAAIFRRRRRGSIFKRRRGKMPWKRRKKKAKNFKKKGKKKEKDQKKKGQTKKGKDKKGQKKDTQQEH